MLVDEFDVPVWLAQFMEREKLPDSFLDHVFHVCLPLAEQLNGFIEHTEGTYVLGLNGGQGTGKSTIGSLLALIMKECHGKTAAVVSLDDLYLTKAEREELANSVHPLLKTRGVPGTHDVALGMRLLDAVRSGCQVEFPVFDKAVDDRSVTENIVVPAGVDILIFEGWCIGAIAEESVDEPVNDFEGIHDAQARWRTYVNEQLAGPYQKLFSFLDTLVMLKAPSFECIYQWRGLQERKLAQRVQQEGGDHSGVMSEKALIHFISHYERLTRHMLAEMPNRAEVVIELAENHSVARIIGIR